MQLYYFGLLFNSIWNVYMFLFYTHIYLYFYIIHNIYAQKMAAEPL